MKSLRRMGRPAAARARAQVVQGSAEAVGLGQDRHRGRPAALVGRDDLLQGDPVADEPGGRRAALVLGDDPQAGLSQGIGERPRRVGGGPIAGGSLDGRGRRDRAPLAHPDPGLGDDRGQRVAHVAGARLWVAATNRSRASAAAPASIARCAAVTPSASDPAPPPA